VCVCVLWQHAQFPNVREGGIYKYQ
jgi:hypothetical protein